MLDKNLKLEYILLKFLYVSTGHIKKVTLSGVKNYDAYSCENYQDDLKLQLKDEKVSFSINRYTLDLNVNDSVSLDDLTDVLLKNQ